MTGIDPFWIQVNEPTLRQGDWLPHCLVPSFGPDISPDGLYTVQAEYFNLVVVSQSCDLEQKKLRLVATCPIFTLSKFEENNPGFAKKGRWNEVLKGRYEGLHLLASPTTPDDPHTALVVDFREVYSLPFDYLIRRACDLGPRWRLRSPYLEHFSQTYARLVMRVGLPSPIPPFP